MNDDHEHREAEQAQSMKVQNKMSVQVRFMIPTGSYQLIGSTSPSVKIDPPWEIEPG